MIKKNRFLLLAATHGDEPSSYEIIKDIRRTYKTLNKKFDFIVANPRALRMSKRFLEQDLNRSAPGNIKSKIYEEKRAAEIKKITEKYKFVIDIHASNSKCGIVTIVPFPTIENIVFEPEVGSLYYGKVSNIRSDFGAWVELAPGKDGLVKIKDLEFKRTEKVEDVLHVGDMTWVKVMNIDDRGRIDLSRKDALKERGEA